MMSVTDVDDLPEKRKSTVILARVGKDLHVRVFDSVGFRIADRTIKDLAANPSLTELKNQLTSDGLAAADSISVEARQAMIQQATDIAELTPDAVRERLIQTVKHGGKGRWTEVSKHVPMPPFSAQLTDAQIGDLVDWILLRAGRPTLRVMKSGLGTGVVTSSPSGIDCGADCEQTLTAGAMVTLTATADVGSEFVHWEEGSSDATTTDESNPITLTINETRTLRAVFDLTTPIPELTDFTPDGIQTFLTANPNVTTPARFLKALPAPFKQNWILMSRSESLQTGTAASPRILLPSNDAQAVFTVGMTLSSSYPGSHPNVVEFMQWDAAEKNFRFHEIVLDAVPQMDVHPPRSRGVVFDDVKCSKCHSTRNVLNRSSFPGTSGITPGTIQVKSKPNWDPYDSWAGMLPFNRDRIYQGSLEAAAFRTIFNLWNWRDNQPVRMILEQLVLQPDDVPPSDQITRHADGTIKFAFDPVEPVTIEPAPVGTLPSITTNYAFDAQVGAGPQTTVVRNQTYLTLHHAATPDFEEGRGVQLFDLIGGLDGQLNQTRIADELINHRYATGSVPIDVRPVALAIARGLIRFDPITQTITSPHSLSVNFAFFDARNGVGIQDLIADTRSRAESIPRRKADFQKLNLDRNGDFYQKLDAPVNGLIAQFGGGTTAGTDTSLGRVRQEVFRRPTLDEGFNGDSTVMNGIYVDRELYSQNTELVALFRYFLEPLGVSVDKWSLAVRGRSRSYAFADVFGTYTNQFVNDLTASLRADVVPGLTDPDDPAQLIAAVNQTLALLPATDAVPRYTDIQRIFNKSCIECHGGLNYPPYSNKGTFVDLSEDEAPPAGSERLRRAYSRATIFTSADPATSYLYGLITRDSEACTDDTVVGGMMPCGGPSLSKADTETIRRWIVGGVPYSFGDPHIRTVNGVSYDFQAAGEFVFLRDALMELQVRTVAVSTQTPVGPNGHTGLTSCVSVNGALAVRIGNHRITYQPNSQAPDPAGLQLRVNGELVPAVPEQGITLPGGVRISRTTAPGGIQIEARGGTAFIITPAWWDHYQLWYLNIDTRHIRATDGVMGAVAPGNWLPALPDGTLLGPMPEGLQDRYDILYGKFGKAWRVTEANSLFDYAPGTNTNSFIVEDWPNGIDSQNCEAPHVPGGPVEKPSQPPLTREQATQLCGDIQDQELRNLAIIDVMATGEAGFAKAYRQADLIRARKFPPVPVVMAPGAALVEPPVNLAWAKPPEEDAGELTYTLYVWPVDEEPEEKHAIPVTAVEADANPQLIAKSVPALAAGKAYYWKVVVQDQYGGRTESKMQKLEVKN
jgi:mono/diheme cytochrome c family protein